MRSIPILLLAIAPLLAAADDGHVTISLLSEHAALVPGKTLWLALRLQHEPHWHTYWINPGDSGLPTKFAWQLPAGYAAGDIAWPTPQRIAVGELQNFGYEGDVLLLVPLDVPSEAKPDTTAHIGAQVKYLVCHEECIPGKADLAVDLPVRSASGTALKQFETARAQLPQPAKWKGEATLQDEKIEFALHGADLPVISDAYVMDRKIVNYAPPQISRNGDTETLSFAKSDYFTVAPPQIDLLVRAGARAWSVRVPFSSSP
jgi:DsbC/DsbD-like thiol-disulfide interchange protein